VAQRDGLKSTDGLWTDTLYTGSLRKAQGHHSPTVSYPCNRFRCAAGSDRSRWEQHSRLCMGGEL